MIRFSRVPGDSSDLAYKLAIRIFRHKVTFLFCVFFSEVKQ